MPRVVLHPGFHKTGTSSAEHTLLTQADLLRPWCDVYGRRQLGQAPRAAKRVGMRPGARRLSAFAQGWAEVVRRMSRDRAAVFTCVDLLGQMPGHPKVADYRAAPDLVRVMVQGLEDRFGRDLDLRVVLSVRDAGPWLKSLWFQNLKVHRITEDLAAFSTRFTPVSDLRAQADSLRPAIGAWPVAICTLEQSRAHPLGPAGALSDLIEMPDDMRAALVPHPPLKVSFGDEGMAVLLDLNRSDLAEDDLRAAKHDAIRLLRQV